MHTLPKENVDSTKLGIPTKKNALQKKKKKGITKSERQAQIEQILATHITDKVCYQEYVRNK